MKTCKCNVAPIVKEGQAVKENDTVYWRQIFVCNNPNCDNYQKKIWERKINVLDQSDVIEE